MNIIVFYEHLVREWEASNILADGFRRYGNTVEVFSIIFERTKAYEYCRENPVDEIFVPWFVNEQHEEIISKYIETNKRMKIINLHQEQICSHNSESLIMPITPFAKNGVYHMTWGKHFKESLLSAGVKEDKIYITGNLRVDAKQIRSVGRESIANEYGLSKDKKWILFAENRGWLTSRQDSKTKELLKNRGWDDQRYEEMLRTEQTNLEVFNEDLMNLRKEFFERYEFIYRPHPGTRMSIITNPSVHIISDRPISDWINCCELYLTCESTSIFEADMCGKPCAIIPGKIRPREDDKMTGVWDYPAIHSVSDICEDLVNQIILEMGNEKIYARYIGLKDGKTLDRIIEAANAIYNDETEIVSLKRIDGKMWLKQILFEKLTRYTVKHGLINRIKVPRSAYIEKKDIPFSPENKWIHEIRGYKNM